MYEGTLNTEIRYVAIAVDRIDLAEIGMKVVTRSEKQSDTRFTTLINLFLYSPIFCVDLLSICIQLLYLISEVILS